MSPLIFIWLINDWQRNAKKKITRGALKNTSCETDGAEQILWFVTRSPFVINEFYFKNYFLKYKDWQANIEIVNFLVQFPIKSRKTIKDLRNIKISFIHWASGIFFHNHKLIDDSSTTQSFTRNWFNRSKTNLFRIFTDDFSISLLEHAWMLIHVLHEISFNDNKFYRVTLERHSKE